MRLIVRRLLYGRSAAKLGKNLAGGLPETLGYASDIQFALAAQADAVTAVGQFAEECRHFHIADGEDIIHQAFAILFLGGTALHLLLRYRYPSEVSFLM